MLDILSLCAFLFRFVFICGVCSSFLWPSGACSVMTGRWLAFATTGGDESPLSDSIATGGDESPLRDSIDQGRPMGGGAAVSVAIVPWAPPTSKVPFGWVSPAEHRDMRRCAGAFARFPLQRCADELAIFAKTDVTLLDSATASLHAHFLGAGVVHMQSKATLGEALGINPRTIENKLSRLSCCLSHCDRIAHSRFIQTMVAHSARLLMFVDLCRYDATPLPIGVDQHLDDVLHHTGLLGSADVLATALGRAVSTPAPFAIGKHRVDHI